MPLSITIKELLPIMVAVVMWGRHWQAQKVLCHCDNQAVVAVLRSRSSKQPQLMHMLRCLFFVEASYGFELSASYIPTEANDLADDLSRNNLSSFLCKVPALKRNPVKVPCQLLEILIDTSGDWTSRNWMRRFRDIFTTVSPHPRTDPTTAIQCI